MLEREYGNNEEAAQNTKPKPEYPKINSENVFYMPPGKASPDQEEAFIRRTVEWLMGGKNHPSDFQGEYEFRTDSPNDEVPGETHSQQIDQSSSEKEQTEILPVNNIVCFKRTSRRRRLPVQED